jgi:isoleucyl-tRNA synthetase
LANNDSINWVPQHIKTGRFGNWLEHNVDWALSRERYWGTPLPIWICEACGKTDVVGSIRELALLSNREVSNLDLHRPLVTTWMSETAEAEVGDGVLQVGISKVSTAQHGSSTSC